jgi:hypothetical protein
MTRPHLYPALDARQSTFSDLEPLELVHSHMPRWLLDAPPGIIDALNAAMAQSRGWHGRIGKKFAQLQSVEAYCGTLLAAEVIYELGPSLDVHRDFLAAVHTQVITDNTLLMTVRRNAVHDEPKTLLWAALQNFSEAEVLPGGFHPQSRILHGGHAARPSAVLPHEFAALCRRLDLGRKYQAYLQHFLGVAAPGTLSPGATHLATEANLRQLKTFDMEVDTHIAFLKNKIDETAYRALLAVLALPSDATSSASVKLDGKPIFHSSLSLLDTVIDGVVVFSADSLLLHPAQRLIVYIPNDPGAPFFEFSSLQVFTDELKHRLRDPAYATFFSRFVALKARAGFMQKVNAHPEALFLTAAPLGMSAAQYLTTVQLKNMFADAQVLAVPTSVLDEQEREARWQTYKNAGLLLINVAALFVPVLGDLMLAVAIGEMLKEVYEGVEDWAQGDVDHAREHLLNVARDIAVNAAFVVGSVAVSAAARRLSQATRNHFEGFAPILRDDGAARLWGKQLQHYEHKIAGQMRHTADAQGFFRYRGADYVEVDGKHYRVEFDHRLSQWRIAHPTRATAFRPALLHNRQGAWQHAHELPLEWEGSATLLGRLGGPAATLDEQTLEHISALTDTAPGLMRRVHLENLPTPPLLRLSLKRFEIDRQLTAFIEQMNGQHYGAQRWADLQLQLLPSLPHWPAGRGLAIVDATGQSLAHYGSTFTRINLTPGVLEQGKLLEAVLGALSQSETRALLGNRMNPSGEPAQRLAQILGIYARDHRASVFDRLYGQFDLSTSPHALPIERAFPGLPRSVAQTMVESATQSQRDLLHTAKVPVALAEMARVYVREARLNRALEGFYLSAQANQDTEKLALHYFEQLAGMSAQAALEIREDSLLGAVIHKWGNEEAFGKRVLVRTALGYQRYRPRGSIYVLEPGGPLPLLTALFQSLTPFERQTTGLTMQADAPRFNSALAQLAATGRKESARVLGMQPIKPTFKAPVALADGRTGYPLCGLGAGDHSWALQRRVRLIYPDFDDEQVLEYLDGLIERGIEPLSLLRESKRQRRALMDSLQDWINSTPTDLALTDVMYDYPENRYWVAGLIERSWRKNPQHIPWGSSDEAYSLNLDGFRIESFPALPAVADFSHIRELKLSNMSCRDMANGFLEHFSGLISLEMDNNRMVHLPSQLERMPNLKRLSVAHNLLYLNPGNQAILNALSKLEVLNLNDNLLGPQLDLRGLAFLRRIYVRRTWITEWPQGLISRPLLETADLRENRLTEIPEHVYLATPSVARNLSLTGNPLSAGSRLRLARYAMQGDSSMGINSEELMTEAAAFDFWTAGITTHELQLRELLWNTLRADSGAEDFFVVISRLTATADAMSVRQDLSRRVWEMIEAANEDGVVRSAVLDIAASPRSCTDSVALTFSDMEVQVELARISYKTTPEQAELLGLSRGLFRLDKLSKIANERYLQRLQAGETNADELEIHLAYRIGLAQCLDLPGQPGSMAFRRLAGVTEQDLELARAEVEQAEETIELRRFISTQQYWKSYLITHNQMEYSALSDPYFENLNQLLRRSPDMSSERYLREVSSVRMQMEAVVDAWCLEKTSALMAAQESGVVRITAL